MRILVIGHGNPIVHVGDAIEHPGGSPGTVKTGGLPTKALCGKRVTNRWMPMEATLLKHTGWTFYRSKPFCDECLWRHFMPETEA